MITLSLFGLAPSRVFHALLITKKAVSSYLTVSPLPRLGGLFSVALSLGSLLPGVTWYFFLWSPDFPLYKNRATIQSTSMAYIANYP